MIKPFLKRSEFRIIQVTATPQFVDVEGDEAFIFVGTLPRVAGVVPNFSVRIRRQRERDLQALAAANPTVLLGNNIGSLTPVVPRDQSGRVPLDQPATLDGRLLAIPNNTTAESPIYQRNIRSDLAGYRDKIELWFDTADASVTSVPVIIETVHYIPADVVGV